MEEREHTTADRRPANKRPAGSHPSGKRPASSGTRKRRPQNGRRPVSKKSMRARKRRRNFIIRCMIIGLFILFIAGLLFFWRKYGSSKEMADLNVYYGIENNDDLAIVVDDKVIGQGKTHKPGGKIYDGIPYVEYTVLRDHINSWFYWDSNENLLLYTLANGSVTVEVGQKEYTDVKDKKSEDYVILKTEGKTAYIALPFVQKYSDMDYQVFEAEGDKVPARAVVNCKTGDIKSASLKRKTPVRQEAGTKTPVLTKSKKSDKVIILKEDKDWTKVRTEDGFVGYVKNNSLKRIKTENITREFEEPEYSNIKSDKVINLALHSVQGSSGSGALLEAVAKTKGLTTIAPTWFSVSDVKGNMSSIADGDYVNYAHQSGLDVWGVLRDFGNGINSEDETFELLSYTSRRENLINHIVAEALKTGIDGINVDFEKVSKECGDHYIQFIRELSVKCRQNSLVLAVNNYVPAKEKAYYRMDEQAKVADFVIIMAYDEHEEGSPVAGSVSSYEFVKTGIEESLKVVPKEKLICAVPFYTRLWKETPKTDKELEADKGTDNEKYPNKVESITYGMGTAASAVEDSKAELVWDEEARQYFATWEYEDNVYKIWLEEEDSLTEKLKLMKDNKLAGVASRRLGLEKSGIWDLILQYVN